MFRGLVLAASLGLAFTLSPPAATALELLMVEQPGCVYCARWKEEIGPIYPKTEVGETAPIRMVQKDAGPPEGMRYNRPVVFTPTFILVGETGVELGRVEGYPGEDFFWPLIENLVEANSDAAPMPQSH